MDQSADWVKHHPLTIRRRKFYSTWYGKLTRADSYVNAWIGSGLLAFAMILFSFGKISLGRALVFCFLGLVWGTLYEYINHRFFFHRWVSVPGLRSFKYVHLPHHIDLKEGVNAGPFSYFPVYLVWFFLLTLVFDSSVYSAMFMTGMCVWFMWYEFQHDYDHLQSRVLKGTLFQLMRKLHESHHDFPEINFGITQPFWDWVFRTYRR